MDTRIVNSFIRDMTIRERKDGLYEGRIRKSYYRLNKSFYGKTKKEVKTKAREYLIKYAPSNNDDDEVDKKTITLSQYYEGWLADYKCRKVKASTYERLVSLYKTKIHPVLGDKLLAEIAQRDIQIMLDMYAFNADNAISFSTLKKIKCCLNECFNQAIADNLISKNPCLNVKLPHRDSLKVMTKEQRALSDKEIEAFKRAALLKWEYKDEYVSRCRLVLLLILNTGLRLGEVRALRWSDIDEEQGCLIVNKQVQSCEYIEINNEVWVKRNVNHIGSQKTAASKREIPINEGIQFCLDELRSYDLRNGIESEYIACGENGQIVDGKNLYRSLKRLLADAGIESQNVTVHTLRHSFGSYLLRHGVKVEYVSALLGHASISITYNVYIHVLRKEKFKVLKSISVA